MAQTSKLYVNIQNNPRNSHFCKIKLLSKQQKIENENIDLSHKTYLSEKCSIK